MDSVLRQELEDLVGCGGSRRATTEGKHNPQAEEMTTACEVQLATLQRTLVEFKKVALALSQQDSTHGERVWRAVKGLGEEVRKVELRIREMRTHLDEDTP